MDVDELQRYIMADGPCAAVVFVDHNGYTEDDLDRVAAFCRRRALPLIEDAAVALGCARAGRVGTLSILSFSVPKIITTGQGGAVLTEREDLAVRLRQLVDQGGGDWRESRIHTALGGNFRMTDIQAALGEAQLADLPRLLARRAQLWEDYRQQCIPLCWDVRPSGWMVTLRASSPAHADAISDAVHAAGFDCKRLYQPVHRCAPYRDTDAAFPGAADVYQRTLYLPSSLNLSWRQVGAIGAAIRGVSL